MTLEQAILEALSRSELPLKAGDVVKLVKPTVGKAAIPKAVAAVLESLTAAGTLNRIAGKAQPLFTSHGLESVTSALLKHLMQSSKKEQQAVKLKAKLPVGLQPLFESALSQLTAQGDAFILPGAKRLVYARRPKSSELLSAPQRLALQKILQTANSVRAQPATWEDFIAWLDSAPPAPPAESAVIAPGEADLRAWYDLDRLRSSTMMIPIPQTFAHYQAWAAERGGVADSQVLRSLIETLYNNGHLLLEPCERPQDLPDHERALLVPMSLGPPGYSWCWIS